MLNNIYLRILLSVPLIYYFVSNDYVGANPKKLSIPLMATIFTVAYLIVRMTKVERGFILNFIIPIISLSAWFTLCTDAFLYGKIWLNEYQFDQNLIQGKHILAAMPYALIGLFIWILMVRDVAQETFIYFNIDLLPHDDTQWINELKQEKKSKRMVAYSKKGARAARIKAIELGLKDVFVDFVSEEEADKARGYKKTS
jgi:hypothetical protein